MKIPSKDSSQARTLKLHVNLLHHQRGRVTTLQRLRSMTLLPKIPRKTYLVILEAANTTYALILILITQNFEVIDVCKNLIKPLSMCYSHSPIFFLLSHRHYSICFFFGANPYKSEHQQSNSTLTNNA